MNYKMVAHTVGIILRIEAILMLLPALVAALYGESTVMIFLVTAAVTMLASMILTYLRPESRTIFAKEGFLIVAVSWIALSLFGALPFYISGEVEGLINCFFETVSGFTTTGSSILTEIEPLSRGLLFWRSFTHWIGGMGVLVFALAILPMAEGRSMHILRAEVPGPTVGKLVPKMRTTAMILYGIYLFLTAVEVLFLLFGGMDLYDSVVHAFATAGTGGFSVKNASIGAYQSPYFEWVIGVFMLLFGINFNLFYFILIGKIKDAFKSEELRWYLGIVAISVAAIAVNIAHLFENVGDALRTAFFNVSSIITTTGFVTVNYDLWPQFSKIILVLLMVVGACAGSTGGGIKVSRFVILLKSVKQEVRKLTHPRAVKHIKFEGHHVDNNTVESVGLFFCAYAMIFLASVLVVSLNGFDFATTTTSVLTCIGNVGPGLGAVGPVGNFAEFSVLSKLVLCFDMLAGRLEVFPMIILFSPFVWKKK